MQLCQGHEKEQWFGQGVVLANSPAASGVQLLTLEAPEFARRVRPGQFVMLRLPQCVDPLLGRPFAVFDADPQCGRVKVLYAVVGKGTARLQQVSVGERLELWGPLGVAWDRALAERNATRLALVAGGIGCAPFYTLIKELMSRESSSRPEIVFVYGARDASRLACVEDFKALGISVLLVTEDGSLGRRGLVTDLLPEIFPEENAKDFAQILACGPHPMMRAVAKWTLAHGVNCWTSLESPMACGLGLCFSCVVPWLNDQGEWDYRRTCVYGPIFDAARLKWD